MSPKRIQPLFLIGISCIALHFSILFGKEYGYYLSLAHSAPAKVEKWEIVPVKKEFGIKAHFSFNNGSQGSFVFPPPYFPSEPAAFSKMKPMAKSPWTAYYKLPESPSLKKEFPFGTLVRAAICWAILIYFLNIKKLLTRSINKKFLSLD